MNDTQLDAQLRTLYNLIYDSAFLIQELDSGIRLLLAQNPHLQEKYQKQIDEARRELTERRGTPVPDASDILARIRREIGRQEG